MKAIRENWAPGHRKEADSKKTGKNAPGDRLTNEKRETIAEDRQLTVQMTETATKENKAYIAEKYGKTKTKRAGRRVDAASYYRGIAAGDGVSLNRQIR